MFSLGKRSLREALMALCDYLKGVCSKVEVSHIFQVASNIMRGNGLKLHQERFGLDIKKKKFFSEKFIRHWNRLPNESVESPPLVQ